MSDSTSSADFSDGELVLEALDVPDEEVDTLDELLLLLVDPDELLSDPDELPVLVDVPFEFVPTGIPIAKPGRNRVDVLLYIRSITSPDRHMGIAVQHGQLLF